MLLIPCPHCGPRDEGEFSYGGPKRRSPAMDLVSDSLDWHRALHVGHNPRGPSTELWYHASGCETWIEITRDTATHDILGSTQRGTA